MMRWPTAMTHGLYDEMFSMDQTVIYGGLFYGARSVLCRHSIGILEVSSCIILRRPKPTIP